MSGARSGEIPVDSPEEAARHSADEHLLRLGKHPEVGVCFRCVTWLSKRKHEFERTTRRAPINMAWWRRVLYRLGDNRC
jgi:hypothetical protein